MNELLDGDLNRLINSGRSSWKCAFVDNAKSILSKLVGLMEVDGCLSDISILDLGRHTGEALHRLGKLILLFVPLFVLGSIIACHTGRN